MNTLSRRVEKTSSQDATCEICFVVSAYSIGPFTSSLNTLLKCVCSMARLRIRGLLLGLSFKYTGFGLLWHVSVLFLCWGKPWEKIRLELYLVLFAVMVNAIL